MTLRLERLLLVLIVAVVGAAAEAASFAHMHDWTMTNSPLRAPRLGCPEDSRHCGWRFDHAANG
jgi:hypothetical protein